MNSFVTLALTAVWSLSFLLPLSIPVSGTGTAWGAPAPISEIRVLRNAEVKQKDVSLADICDRATISQEWQVVLSGINIGDAPLAGSEKFIDPGQLKDYLVRVIESQGLNSSDVKLDIPDRIVVRRESTLISQEQIEAIFTKYITGQFSLEAGRHNRPESPFFRHSEDPPPAP